MYISLCVFQPAILLGTEQEDLKKVEAELAAVRGLGAEQAGIAAAFASRVEIFLEEGREVVRALENSLECCEKLLKSTLSKFGYKAKEEEDVSKGFFGTLVEIISLTGKASDDVDRWQEQERKAAEKAAKLESKNVNACGTKSGDTSVEEVDKKDQQNIFGNFRDQQKASSDDIILQLKKKMDLRRQKAEQAVQ